MEANLCDVNHLDADVLLPPRKRLLAGLKRQNCESDCASHASCFASSSSSSPSSVFDAHLNNLLHAHTGDSDLSPEEIVEASKSAAAAKAKAANAARAAAEEKAAIAVKAMAAARNALELVASFPEELGTKDRSLKRNKLQKHVPVHSLYKNQRAVESCGEDEELARKLHRAINSSPRISKNSSSSDSKGQRKRPRILPNLDEARVPNAGVLPGEISPKCNGHAVMGEVDSEGSTYEVNVMKVNENWESGRTKERVWDDGCISGKRRGRVKLKKLPLSICTSKDQANPKDESNNGRSPSSEQKMGKPVAGNVPLFSVEPSKDGVRPFEATPIWKCQEFKAPACVKQNKAVQS